MNTLLFGPATDAAARIRERTISARELTEALLEHIAATNPRVNAVVELRAEAALKEAAAADDLLARGAVAGALHGVPMTIKESIHVAGMHSTWGNPAFADHVPDDDATLVARLRAAGAIVVGTTNVPAMLADNQTFNDLHGVTTNPWDPARTPGGSSGGAAAAVATGMTFLEFGSDLAGSVRNPAGFCGVYGLRPSLDVVPLTGHRPPGPQPEVTMYLATLGPLARSAADLRAALRAVGGPDGRTAAAYSWQLPPARHDRVRDFRVAFVLDHPRAPVSDEVASVLSDAVDALASAGARLVEGVPDGVDLGEQAEAFGSHMQTFLQPGGVDRPDRLRARATWNAAFDDIDVFLSPVNVTTAFPHDHTPFEQRTLSTSRGDIPYAEQFFWIAPATLTGFPAASVPVGTTDAGLPVGMQVMGPLYEDDTVLTFAELLADVAGGFTPPPLQ